METGPSEARGGIKARQVEKRKKGTHVAANTKLTPVERRGGTHQHTCCPENLVRRCRRGRRECAPKSCTPVRHRGCQKCAARKRCKKSTRNCPAGCSADLNDILFCFEVAYLHHTTPVKTAEQRRKRERINRDTLHTCRRSNGTNHGRTSVTIIDTRPEQRSATFSGSSSVSHW
jgi:hypothetical protein